MATLGPYDMMFQIHSGANAGNYGFMARKNESGGKMISVQEIGGPAVDRVVTAAAASYQDFDPRYDTVFSMTSFAGGMGQLEYEHGGVGGKGNPEKYWWGDNLITHVDGKAFPSGLNELTSFASSPTYSDFENARFYAWVDDDGVRYDIVTVGRYLYYRSADATAATTWTQRVDTGGSTVKITDVIDYAIGSTLNGVHVAMPAVADANDWYKYGITDVWSVAHSGAEFSTALGKPIYWARVGATLVTVAKDSSGLSNKIFLSSDDGYSWAGPITVTQSGSGNAGGDGKHRFTGLKAAGNAVLVFKENAVLSVTPEQDVTEVIWQFKDSPHPDNFKYQAVDGENVIFNVRNEVYSYDPYSGTLESLRLSRQDGFNVSSIAGLGADNGFVYILANVTVPRLYESGMYVVIRAYKRADVWVFENVWTAVELSGHTIIGFGALPNSTGTRLYVCFKKDDGLNAKIDVKDIPREWDESTVAINDDQFAILYTSISRANFPGFLKRHLWLGVEGDNLFYNSASDKASLTVSYSVDGGNTFTALGETADSDTARFEYSAASGNSIVLKFIYGTVGALPPAVLRVFDHHQRVRFRYLPLVTANVILSDYAERNNGTKDSRTAATLYADLVKLRTEDGRISYVDILGNSFDVTIGQMAVQPVEHRVKDAKPSIVELDAVIEIGQADAGS